MNIGSYISIFFIIVILILIILVIIDILFLDKVILNSIFDIKTINDKIVLNKTYIEEKIDKVTNYIEITKPANESAAIFTTKYKLGLSQDIPLNIKQFIRDPENKLFKNKVKYINVFDCIDIIAMDEILDLTILHVANIVAEWLDNDKNGIIDDNKVYYKLKGKKFNDKATIIIFTKETDLQFIRNIRETYFIKSHNLFTKKIRPEGFSGNKTDSTIEETLHLITKYGWSEAYPSIFGATNSSIKKAMDKARGGIFTVIPKKYPKTAWYTYYDLSCNYDCQINEYLFWATITYLGGFNSINWPGREVSYKEKWKPTTKAELLTYDPDIYNLLEKTKNYPIKNLPKGNYSLI